MPHSVLFYFWGGGSFSNGIAVRFYGTMHSQTPGLDGSPQNPLDGGAGSTTRLFHPVLPPGAAFVVYEALSTTAYSLLQESNHSATGNHRTACGAPHTEPLQFVFTALRRGDVFRLPNPVGISQLSVFSFERLRCIGFSLRETFLAWLAETPSSLSRPASDAYHLEIL